MEKTLAKTNRFLIRKYLKKDDQNRVGGEFSNGTIADQQFCSGCISVLKELRRNWSHLSCNEAGIERRFYYHNFGRGNNRTSSMSLPITVTIPPGLRSPCKLYSAFNFSTFSNVATLQDNREPIVCSAMYSWYFGQRIGRLNREIHFPSLESFTCTLSFVMDSGNTSETTALHQNSMFVAETWINQCSSSHAECRRPTSHFLPTRLLDVGTETDCKVRLVLSKDLSLTLEHSSIKYLTLSHCWGKRHYNMLKKDNITEFLEECIWDDLPPLFQDAVTVARRLNQRYLWIDSLCIIQDDLEDWQQESCQMNKVYQHSYCNLSATSAEDGSQKILFAPELRRFTVLVPFIVGGVLLWFPFYYDKIWDEIIEHGILNTRAWVCQERFLSPCNLHSSSEGFFWECGWRSKHELIPHRIWEIDYQSAIKQTFARGFYGRYKRRQSEHYSWYHIISICTSGKLTFGRNKLIALAGLASLWAEFHNDEYFAGLWKKDFPRCLLWCGHYGRPVSKINQEYVAPTWSWASVEGKVDHAGRHGTEFPDIYEPGADDTLIYPTLIELAIEHIGSSPYGQVQSGSLLLKTRLGVCSIYALPLAPDSDDFGELYKECLYWYPDSENIYGQDITCTISEIFLLPVVETSRPFSAFAKISRAMAKLEGLVLNRAPTKSVQFARIGIFEAVGAKNIARIHASLEDFDGHELAKTLYLDSGGCKPRKYTIKLI